MSKPSSLSSSRPPSTELVAPRCSRRVFTTSDKPRIVQEAANCAEREKIEALLRRGCDLHSAEFADQPPRVEDGSSDDKATSATGDDFFDG